MTLEELYELIGGNYEAAMNVMRMEKLVDRYIRKFDQNNPCEALLAAGQSMDATGLYENAHALKGICANLGLDKLSAAASEITEEFRPGNERQFSDEEVQAKLQEIEAMYRRVIDGIHQYTGE